MAACTIFSCIHGHTEEKEMATTLLTAALKHFGRNWWVRYIINDGVETSARKSQPRFQIIQAGSAPLFSHMQNAGFQMAWPT